MREHIRIIPEQWQCLERAAAGTVYSANQLLVELAMEAFDHHDSSGAEAELGVARASLFTAQSISRELLADGRKQEVQNVRDFVSTIVPDIDDEPLVDDQSASSRASTERTRTYNKNRKTARPRKPMTL